MTTTRIVPSTDKFPGMTSMTRNGRTVSCVGVGKAVEKVIAEKLKGEGE